jgi:hypothetical protein
MGVNMPANRSTTSSSSSSSSTGSSQAADLSADAGHHGKLLLQQYAGMLDAAAGKRIVETERVIQDTFQR